ncbi:MAG: Flagellar biosynthetic protein FlhF [Desulfotomaculum sp. 46_296]|nr:MAG: Flagellar biosynthetic protein FlhF [Desulfotomaculum sp. 46_296]HAU32323.1 flagellar biosynthesis protein FlhF [Desulfotomaculum sp.]
MKVKKYFAEDMQQAISEIKKDMGSEAIIISQRRVRGKGVLGFFVQRLEVTAALEENNKTSFSYELEQELQQDLPESGQKFLNGMQFEQNDSVDAEESIVPESEYKFNPAFADLSLYEKADPSLPIQEELKEMRSLIEQMVSAHENSKGVRNEHLELWRHKLQTHGLGEASIDMLLKIIPEDSWEDEKKVKSLLTDYLSELLKPLYNGIRPGQVLSFIGPTGVGKTTTLAKLAAQLALNQRKKVAILTIDTYRIGAIEQLQTYAEIIGVPLQVVMSPDEFKDALLKNGDRDYILIDSAGQPFSKDDQSQELQAFLREVDKPHDVFLVLSSNTKSADLLQAAAYFMPCGYNKLIFTKSDETLSQGSILDVINKVKLPVIYITNGQNVPDDILKMEYHSLASFILDGVD